MNTSPKLNHLQAIRYKRGAFELLNQLELPQSFVYEPVTTVQETWNAIRQMKVRGAPAIAIAAVLGLAVDLQQKTFRNVSEACEYICTQLSFLKTSRPTAVNLFEAADRLTKLVQSKASMLSEKQIRDLIQTYTEAAEAMLEADVRDNKNIGKFGAEFLLNGRGNEKLTVLTHCNTGSLATAGYGTALGIVRALHERGQLEHAYCTETRPYNQGARLTAFELVYEKIPATLIADSMVAFLMATKKVDCVIVGADRVVANGDTANKIGTYQLAISAWQHKIPFIVAAPLTSIDTKLASGSDIHIEERPANELTHVDGRRIAAEGIGVWNPSFDVTPASFISAIVTERGAIVKDKSNTFDLKNWQAPDLLR